MDETAKLRPAPKLKHLYAALAAFAAYFITAMAGMWVGLTGGLVLQELGLIRRWGKHFELWQAFLLFASGLVLAAGGLLLLWKMRRLLILAAKMCWYVPKAYLVWGAGACGTLGLAGMMVVLSGCTVGLRQLYLRFFPGILPEPLWLRAVIAGAGLALMGVCVAAATLIAKVVLRIAKVDDWRASVARSLGRIDMLAPPRPSSSAESDV